MRIKSLIKAIARMLEDSLKDYEFRDPEGEPVSARVFIHGLPDGQDAHIYPFVCVRWAEGELNEEQHNATCRDTLVLALGVYEPSSQEEAGLMLSELLDAVIYAVRKNRIVDGLFENKLPIKSAVPDAERKWNDFHMATVAVVYEYTIPPTPLFETETMRTFQY